METSSTLVIKVKYGDVLRRFNSQIVDGQLNLNADALRKKIISLFSLDANAELMITYIDEDGDVVTLVDDDDIRDVVKQSLNPLRLTVKLSAGEEGKQGTVSTGSSTPLRSPPVETPVHSTNTGVSELLGNLPTPARELLVHIASNLAKSASAGSSSAPGGAELVDYYIKLGLSYCDQPTEFQPEAALLDSQNVNVMPSMQNTKTGFSSLLKKAPKDLRELILKSANSLASMGPLAAGTSSSAPGGTKILDYIRTLILFYLDHSLESQALPGVESSTQSGVPGSTAAAEANHSEHFKDDPAATLKTLSNLRSELSSKSNESTDKCKNAAVMDNVANIPSVTRGHMENSYVDFNSEAGPLDPSNMNATQPSDCTLLNPAPAPVHSKSGVCDTIGNKEKAKKVTESYSNGKSHLPAHMPHASSSVGKDNGSFMSSSDFPSTTYNIATGDEVNNLNESELGSGPANASVSDPNSTGHVDVKETSILPDCFGVSPVSMWAPSFINKYPFSEIAAGNAPTAPPQPASVEVPFKRSLSQNDGSRIIFHRGVRCDGCGIHPIVGPRFKSKVKVDYDLCRACFGEIGNGNDYIRMDLPMAFRNHVPFKGLPGAVRNRRANLPQVYRGCKVKSVVAKLDSCFIQDVNVIDGTVMPPSTPFTKIWRMRNNGAFEWPQGTQLVWIGGDKLSNPLSVELEIPAGAVWMNQELDVAVDFISPKLPGRYISYWRMATPSGQKFGQRVWVLIQVDASLKDTPLENIRDLNLNLPPVSSSAGPEIINVHPEPMGGCNHPESANTKKVEELLEPMGGCNHPESANTKKGEELLEPMGGCNHPEFANTKKVEELLQPMGGYNHPESADTMKVEELLQPNSEQELKFPINDNLLVGNGPSSSASGSVSYPIIDLSDVIALPSVPPRLYPLQPPTLSMPSVSIVPPEVDLEKNQIEEKLLRELEEMGFKHLDLNKEVLRMNEYNLEHAVDDLCGVTEWDPMLEELQEMGFHDREINKKLLKKNNGSIKRVVMDLIAGEMD